MNCIPRAKRVLLLTASVGVIALRLEPIVTAISLGQIDRYTTKPGAAPDEQSHRLITELLHEWQHLGRGQREMVTIVGERLGERSYELRDLFERNGHPFTFIEKDSDEGQGAPAARQTSRNNVRFQSLFCVMDRRSLIPPEKRL